MSPSAREALARQLGAVPEDFPRPLYVVDRVGRIVFCNRAFVEMVGYRAEDMIGKLSLLFYPPEMAPVFLMRRVQSQLGQAVPPTLRTQLRRSDGRAIPVELTITSLEHEGGLAGRVTVVREAREPGPPGSGAEPPGAEYLLHLSQQEADNLPYGLITLDATGTVIGYNEAESRLSGLAPSAVIGRNFFSDIAPCTRVRAFAGLYRHMVVTGEPDSAHFEFVFRFGYGEKRVSILMTYSREAKQGAILVEPRPDAPG